MMATILPLLAMATAAADYDGARRPAVAIVAATVTAEEGGPAPNYIIDYFIFQW